MPEKTIQNEGDWRVNVANQLGKIAVRSERGLRILELGKAETSRIDRLVNLPEALSLSSTERLGALAQHNPVARLLGIETTRRDHTVDDMRLTADHLSHLAEAQLQLFKRLIAGYNLNPEAAIKHFIEYMRRHDEATLAFHGSTHENISVGGEGYHEDKVFLAEYQDNPVYQFVLKLLFDARTDEYYQKYALDKSIVLKIAEDSINGTNVIGRILKKGKDHVAIDWLAYTVRDFTELMRIFTIPDNLPFPDILEQVLIGLQGFSDSLTYNTEFRLPEKVAEKRQIEELVPSSMVKLIDYGGEVRAVYDAESIFQILTMHIVLRLFLSGSPWLRASNDLIRRYYQERYVDGAENLVGRLISTSEEELLATDLKNTLPLVDTGPQMMSRPESIPEQIKGWFYSTEPGNFGPEEFIFKNVGQTLVNQAGRIDTLENVFPDLFRLINEIKSQPKLYLQKQNL